jgi:DNA-binding MarR family transcriptional regulator
MRKIDLLDYLSFEESVSAKDVAVHFGISLGSVYNPLTALNLQGLIRKVRGDDGVLTFSITAKGKERLEYLSENEEEDLEENKPLGGNKKMSRKRYLEDGLYSCPECENEFELEDVLEGSSESLCPDCGVELELVDDGEEEEESEPVRRGR